MFHDPNKNDSTSGSEQKQVPQGHCHAVKAEDERTKRKEKKKFGVRIGISTICKQGKICNVNYNDLWNTHSLASPKSNSILLPLYDVRNAPNASATLRALLC